MRAFQDRFWGARGRAVWTRSFGAGSPAHESSAVDEGEVRAVGSGRAAAQRAREITRAKGERDRQMRSFAEKPCSKRRPLIKQLEAREARIRELEARHGLWAFGVFILMSQNRANAPTGCRRWRAPVGVLACPELDDPAWRCCCVVEVHMAAHNVIRLIT